MWVLIGDGANGLQIPAMLWSDKEKAIAKCIELLGKPSQEKDGKFYWELEESEFDHDKEEFIKKAGADLIYTYYYDGCGECSRATLKEIEEGVPFVHWDLD